VATYTHALEALADPTRRAVMERLRAGPLPVGRVAEGLGVTRPAVSQHLKVLRNAGLVEEEREGTRHLYRVAPRGLVPLRAYLDLFWGDVLEAFRLEASKSARKSRRKGAKRK
jgi:DNA-binding transcriptional ArsR family regulator